MKVDFLPQLQHDRNTRINQSARFLGFVLVFLFICHVASAFYLYNRGPLPAILTNVVGSDGMTVLGDAIIVAPDLAFCLGKVPIGSWIVFGSHDRRPATVIRSEFITDSTEITLLRFEGPALDLILTPTALDDGQHAFAHSGLGDWVGILAKRTDGFFEPRPGLTLGSGIAFRSSTDKTALVGISALLKGELVVVSMLDTGKKFPELNIASGR